MFFKMLIFVSIIVLSVNCKNNTSAESNSSIKTINSNQDIGANSKTLKAKIPSINPNILVGMFSIQDNKPSEDIIWGHDANLSDKEWDGEIKIKSKIEVDVMNCAGYLGSAIATRENRINWKLKYIPESLAEDYVVKAKKCAGKNESGITSYAFAVSPKDRKRKQISFNKSPNYKKIILSLPSELKKWAGIDETKNYEKQFKDHIDPTWTDLDGDGKVDLISLSGKCLPNSKSMCERVVRLMNSKWKQVVRIEPT